VRHAGAAARCAHTKERRARPAKSRVFPPPIFIRKESAMKYEVVSTKGMFTTACGVDVPVHEVVGVADSIPDAADLIVDMCGGHAGTVELGGYVIREVPTNDQA
jgi:hypothetical protein